MKIKYFSLLLIVFIVSTFTLSGQSTNSKKTNIIKSNNDISIMMGTPAYISKADSLEFKVWILSKNKSNEVMNEIFSKMKKDNIEIDKLAKEEILSGTNCVMVGITNKLNGHVVLATEAKAEVVSPKRENSSVELKPLINYVGGGALLNQKGAYLFTINMNLPSGNKSLQFKYRVK